MSKEQKHANCYRHFLLDVGIKYEHLMLIYPKILACATEEFNGLMYI